MLALYRALLDLRRCHPALRAGEVTWLDAEPGVLRLRRSAGVGTEFVVVATAGADRAHLPAGTVLLTTAPLTPDGLLPADAAAIVELAGP